MQITLRPNPKTTGWLRRFATALLAGFGTFMLTLPVGLFAFAAHFNRADPADTQNLLRAVTAAMAVSLFLGGLTAVGCLLLLIFSGALTAKRAAESLD
jgi:ABC-type Fe3+ transport system permease subunit